MRIQYTAFKWEYPYSIDEHEFDLLRRDSAAYSVTLSQEERYMIEKHYPNSQRNAWLGIGLCFGPILLVVLNRDLIENNIVGTICGIIFIAGFILMVVNYSGNMSVQSLKACIKRKEKFARKVSKLAAHSKDYVDFNQRYTSWRKSGWKMFS